MGEADKYQVVLADPACGYCNRVSNGACSRHYETLTVGSIARLPVWRLAADNAALFLWVPSPMLDDGLRVVDWWGFAYKTIAFVWSKLTMNRKRRRIGPGNYTRPETEVCLLGPLSHLQVHQEQEQMSTPTIKLTKLGTDEVVAHACGKCGRVGYNEDAACQCCEPHICECGATCERYYTACPACRDRKESEREDERFEAAEKVAWKSYDGPVWDGGDFYSSAEAYADDHEDIQRYVWAVKTRDLKLDARDVIESALEAQGFTSEADDWIVDESGLQRMLDEWAGKQPMEAWDVDYSRAVLLDGIAEELWPSE